MLNRLIGLSLLVAALVLTACSQQPDAIDSQGKAVYFKKYQDKWIALNYWAEWCKPCYEEIPAFNRFYNNNKDKIIIMGINFDNASSEEISEFKTKLHIDYPMLSTNPGLAFGIKEIPNLPATFLISPDRQKVITLYGPQSESDLSKIIKG